MARAVVAGDSGYRSRAVVARELEAVVIWLGQ